MRIDAQGMACLVMAAAGVLAEAQPADEAAGGFVVRPYLQYATQNSITVRWETAEPARAHVEFGPARLGDNAPNLEHTAQATEQRTMHEVILTGLEPETSYFYRTVSVGEDGRQLSSAIKSFGTAVRPGTPFAFAVFSDSQNNPEVWSRVAELGWQERPNFGIHAGDLVGTGQLKREWVEEFFPPGEPFMSRFPLYTTLGNHENDAQLWYDYFTNPAPEYVYRFIYGDAEFFLIDTNRPVYRGSDIYRWLEYALADSTALWKFVVQHHPPYTSDENDYGDAYVSRSLQGDPAVKDLIPLYERYGVDIVFFGHIHDYERSWPIRDGAIDHEQGVTYLQMGGAGGSLENYAPVRSWFTAKVRRTHHFGMVEIAGDRLTFTAMDDRWRMFDRFTLTKSPRRAAAPAARVAPPPPLISPGPVMLTESTEVTIQSMVAGAQVRYTTDGTEPTSASALYEGPITVRGGQTLKARVFDTAGLTSEARVVRYRDTNPRAAEQPGATSGGLAYRYFEGLWKKLPDFSALQPNAKGTTQKIATDAIPARDQFWALDLAGYITVPATGIYTFETVSDDGSMLWIGDVNVVDNDGDHGPRSRSGRIALEAGQHPIRISFFQFGGGQLLEAYVSGPGLERQPLSVLPLAHAASAMPARQAEGQPRR